MNIEDSLTVSQLREILTSGWDSILNIEVGKDGFIFTMPAAYPDGWQVVLELSKRTPKGFRLSDRGATLAWLSNHGQNVETEAMQRHIQRICGECHIEGHNKELFRWISGPLDGTDVQVFTEGLVGVSHLHVLHEPRVTEEKVAQKLVLRTFSDAGLIPERNYGLSVTKERKVVVDYFVAARHPVAVELITSKHDLSGKMERWGFRWDELKKNYHNLVPVMLYDRNTQQIDSYSRHIGEEKCKLFCGYDETDRIHEVLKKAK